MLNSHFYGDSRIGLSRAIGTNNGCEVRVSEEENVVAFVGLEVFGALVIW